MSPRAAKAGASPARVRSPRASAAVLSRQESLGSMGVGPMAEAKAPLKAADGVGAKSLTLAIWTDTITHAITESILIKSFFFVGREFSDFQSVTSTGGAPTAW